MNLKPFAYALIFVWTFPVVGVLAQGDDCDTCLPAGQDLIFYVDDDAPAFSPNLTWFYYQNDISRPVPAIADAQFLIRQYRALCSEQGEDLCRDVEVRIREGVYTPAVENSSGFPRPLEFTELDSGTEAHSIVYTAYQQPTWPHDFESVLISGGIDLTSWHSSSPIGGNRWWSQKLPAPWATTDFRDELKPRALYVNNIRATRAREPDVSDQPSSDGFATVNYPIYDIQHTGVGLLANQKQGNEYAISVDYLFPENAGAAQRGYLPGRGIECVMRNQGAWISQRQYVRDVVPDSQSGTTYIRLHDVLGIPESFAHGVYVEDSMSCGYTTEIYLENAKEFMDEPYEWWFNPGNSGDVDPTHADNRLWVILPDGKTPPGPHGDPVNVSITIPYSRELFQFEGCSYVQLRHLNLAHTNQELPEPVDFNDLVGNQKVVEVQDPSGTFVQTKKTDLGDTTDVDYPIMGWFERGRTIDYYAATPRDCTTQSDLNGIESSTRLKIGGAVRMTGGEFVSIERCRIAHTGGNAVVIENGRGHSVTESELFDLGSSAVVVCRANLSSQFCGPAVGVSVAPSEFRVRSNYIYDVGKTFISSPAVHCGWTATNDVPDPMPTYSNISKCYINHVPADGVYVGFTPQDGRDRPQSRRLRVWDNIVRNPQQLMDDMAGIVVKRDADDGQVFRNVIYQDAASNGNSKHGLYTDGHSMYGPDGGVTTLATNWSISGNYIWGMSGTAFHMNTRYTCPQYNSWVGNTIDDTDGKWLAAVDFPATPCDFALGTETMRSRICGSGYSQIIPFVDFDPIQYRYSVETGLGDSMTRTTQSQLQIDLAGPDPGAKSFLYTTYDDSIHPTDPPQFDRTPPDP